MSTARDRTIALLVCAAALAGACSRAGPTTPAATLDAAPSPTETAPPTAAPTEAADPYAIPADPKDIDEKYVERVIEALNEGVVVATGEVARSGRITPAVRRALAATHLEGSQEGYLRSFREVVAHPRTLSQFKAKPESVDVVAVKRILTAKRDCLFVLVRQDTSGLTTANVKPFDVYYHLRAVQSPVNSQNPTPWMVAADAQPRTDGKAFENPCAA